MLLLSLIDQPESHKDNTPGDQGEQRIQTGERSPMLLVSQAHSEDYKGILPSPPWKCESRTTPCHFLWSLASLAVGMMPSLPLYPGPTRSSPCCLSVVSLLSTCTVPLSLPMKQC